MPKCSLAPFYTPLTARLRRLQRVVISWRGDCHPGNPRFQGVLTVASKPQPLSVKGPSGPSHPGQVRPVEREWKVGPVAYRKAPKVNEPSRLYSEADCSYFGLVLIPFEEIWWIPVLEIGGRTSICTKIKKDFWQFIAETRRPQKVALEVALTF